LILLFGGEGQLGQQLYVLAQKLTIQIRVLGRHEADITDASQVRTAIANHRPSVVINAAAYTKVDPAELEVERAMQVNASGAGIVAESCSAAGVPLIHVSTDYVFDGKKPGSYCESDPVNPVSVYGRSKEQGEVAVRRALVRHVILRVSWLYGAFGSNFFKTMIRLARDRDEIRVVADQHGCPTSTLSLARAILTIAPRLGESGNWGTFHYAARDATTWYAFADEIIRLQALSTGRQPRVVAIGTGDYRTLAKRPANSVLDCRLWDRVFALPRSSWMDDLGEVAPRLLGRDNGGQAHVA